MATAQTPHDAGRLPTIGTFSDPNFTAYEHPDDPFYLAPNDRDAIINRVAGMVDKWGLSTPAVFMLGLGLPGSFLAGQAMTVFASPFLTPFFGSKRVENWQNFLNNRKHVEMLLDRLERDAEVANRRRRGLAPPPVAQAAATSNPTTAASSASASAETAPARAIGTDTASPAAVTPPAPPHSAAPSSNP